MSAVTTRTGIIIDRATADDLPEAAEVYQAAARHLSGRLGDPDPWTSTSAREDDLRQARQALAGLRAAMPDAVVVARDEEAVVGVAAVAINPPHAHIAFLFVHPGWQNRGIGRSLLEHLRTVIDTAGATVTTLAASRDARAWQRYLRYGLHPGLPVLALRAPSPRLPPALPSGVGLEVRRATLPDLDAIAALDHAVRGAGRRDALEHWLLDGTAVLATNPLRGEVAGYAMATSHTRHCQIGPVAARTLDDAVAMARVALHAAALHPNPRQLPWRADLPGRNQAMVAPLLEAGFTVDALIPWFESGPVGQWNRYIFRDEDAL
jgi:ribosomal protein S18 acetylase RimI-like enzyme